MVTAVKPYLPRELAASVARVRQSLPVAVVTGMRQVGKTTMLQRERNLKTSRYFSFDDPATLEAVRNDPKRFVANRTSMTIDEAQRYPPLLLAIKAEVDRNRQPGRFLLSGSANFALLKEVAETLAGRASYLALEPFSRRELTRTASRPPFVRAFYETGRLPSDWEDRVSLVTDNEVLAGGIPPAALGDSQARRDWMKGFEQTYLERDLRQLSQVADLGAFQRLMRLTALRTGQIMHKASIARDAEMPVLTASRYLRLLETSFVISMTPPYLLNRATRMVKSPKVYVSDSGLACHLMGIGSAQALRTTPQRGLVFETYAVQNLHAVSAAHWEEAALFYWNVQGRHEVDIVIGEPEECLAIEVKASHRWRNTDLEALNAFLRRTPQCRAAILAYNGAKVDKINARLWALPLGLLLS